MASASAGGRVRPRLLCTTRIWADDGMHPPVCLDHCGLISHLYSAVAWSKRPCNRNWQSHFKLVRFLGLTPCCICCSVKAFLLFGFLALLHIAALFLLSKLNKNPQRTPNCLADSTASSQLLYLLSWQKARASDESASASSSLVPEDGRRWSTSDLPSDVEWAREF